MYDGTTSAAPTLTITGGLVSGETVTATGTATFNSKNVASANLVTVNSVTLVDGANGLAGNYSLSNGQTVAASISAKSLTASVAAPNKVYDGTTTAAPTLTITSGLVSGETVTATGTATFNSKDVTNAKLVTVNSVTLADGTNGLATNYSLSNGQTVAAFISAKSLTASVAAPNKVYDGTTTAAPTLTITNGLVSGETVTATGTATFNSKDVKDAKLVTVNSVVLADGTNGFASNYSLSNGQTVAAFITAKSLTANVSAQNKVYDGTRNAVPMLTITSGLVSGETVTATGTATFNSKDVLTANLVTVNSVTLADGVNGLGSNYSLGTGQTAAARIIPASLDIVANDSIVDYSGNPYSGGNGVTSVGFVNGETVAVLDGMLTYAGSSQGAVNSGQYIITPSGLTGDNYAITYVDGILTIQPFPSSPVLPPPSVPSSNYNGGNQNSGSVGNGSNGQTLISGGGTSTGGTDTGSGGGTSTGGTDTGSSGGTSTGGTDTGSSGGTSTGGTDTGSGAGTGIGGTDTGSGGGTGTGSTDTGSSGGTSTGGTDTGSSGGTGTGSTDTGSSGGTSTGGTDTGSSGGTGTGGTDTGSSGGTSTGGTDTGSGGGTSTGGTDTGSGGGTSTVGTDTGSGGGTGTGSTDTGSGGGTSTGGTDTGTSGGTGTVGTDTGTGGGSVSGGTNTGSGGGTGKGGSAGVTVKMVVPSTRQKTGVITVAVPGELLNSGSSFTIPLPAQVKGRMTANKGAVLASLENGDDLPKWIQYNAESKSFTLNQPPAGALPLTVQVSVGDRKWNVVISKK